MSSVKSIPEDIIPYYVANNAQEGACDDKYSYYNLYYCIFLFMQQKTKGEMDTAISYEKEIRAYIIFRLLKYNI
jgi:hypothetical protein